VGKELILFRIRKFFVRRAIATITWLIEKYFRIHTCIVDKETTPPSSFYSDSVSYEPIDYWLIYRFAKKLHPDNHDVFCDIGCGMGRTLCVFARMKLRKCIGIEISPTLADVARKNIHNLRGRYTPVELVVGDAALFDYSGGNLYWLFNPFGSKTMTEVIDKIEHSLILTPRKIKIAYINPVHENVLSGRKLLRFDGRDSAWYSKTTVSYWRNA